MTSFTLNIETDNEAFTGDEAEGLFPGPERRAEVARILRDAARRLTEQAHAGGPLRDANGNTVGRFDFQ